MKRIKSNLIKFIIINLLCTVFVFANRVYASFRDNTPTIKNDGYNVKMSYSINAAAIGDIHYRIDADLTNMDEMEIPYGLAIYKCCDRLVPPSGNGLWVSINGTQVYANRDHEMTSNVNWPTIKYPKIDVRSFRRKDAYVNYDAYANMEVCSYCGSKPIVQIAYYGINFYDYRGTASMQYDSIKITPGQSVTLSPSYNEYADHVAWAVRYPGESGFTLLSEGTNKGGLIAQGVKNRSVTVSSIPFSTDGIDIGVFVYDSDGNLPAGTEFPNTPFFTKLVSTDTDGPIVSIDKTLDKASKSVVVSVNATDNAGLPVDAYSWDGGVTYTDDKSKAFTTPGTYEVIVRDIAGNKTKKPFIIDSNEIEKVNPQKSDDKPTEEPAAESGKGGNSNSGGNDNTSGNTGGGNGDSTKPVIPKTDRPENITNQLKEEENVVVKPIPITDSKNDTKGKTETGTEDSAAGSSSKKKNTNGNVNSPTKLSDGASKGIFDKIRENSEAYMIAMHDSTGNDEIYADVEEEINSSIDMKNSNGESSDIDYKNENEGDSLLYSPGQKKHSMLFWILLIVIILLVILIILFILFFGVIILTDKESELSEIYGNESMKLPVAISFITYENGQFSVCFRELLDKYGMVYARFGLLFAYIFEGEQISITTKFKGDKKREIAKEQIKKEIIVGIKGGKRK